MEKINIEKMDEKAYRRYILAQMIYARGFLAHYDLITDKENENIHKKIKKYQDKYQIEITIPQMDSVYMEYDDNAVEDICE